MAGKTTLGAGLVQIYGLADPVTGEMRYVGKANDASARLKSHIRDSRHRSTPVYAWVRDLLAAGQAPVLRIIAECAPSEWPAVERATIAQERSLGAKLLNVAAGGNEPHCDTATRQANGKTVSKLRVSSDRKARIYHLKRQVGVLLAQGLVTDENKAKLRLAARKAPELFGVWSAL